MTTPLPIIDIIVVGASNMDLVSTVARMPVLGETIHGTSFSTGFGGKGANQAVAAAKCGGKCAFLGKVGTDEFGKEMIRNLQTNHVDVSHVSVTDQASSGVAPIFVDEKGRNSIVIVNGANDLITPQDVDNAENMISKAKILIAQLEIQSPITLHALKLARKHGLLTILNPSPAPDTTIPEIAALMTDLMSYTDIVVPNEVEAAMLSKQSTDIAATPAGLNKVHDLLLGQGPILSLISLGSEGASVAVKTTSFVHPPTLVPCPKLEKVTDTTGAGDCLLGTFAYFLCEYLDKHAKQETTPHDLFVEQLKTDGISFIVECTKKAGQAATFSVQRPGTQKSYPNAEELSLLLQAA
ncbi:putative Bifunctional ribokinase/ribose-5-phosphate isomerase A [Blattamonas nauphoetae]|uniref:Ribokinase n=1 Tax=Blattamonas nauphoetae TaxID=2049346 RepID=A0ABQ9YCG8_9EUKA|nr:putative Bifunctional ribokinase/ribose-5-phosphate isomerase A [Blattamonas nauphoetae]